jgi:hypothetical protein
MHCRHPCNRYHDCGPQETVRHFHRLAGQQIRFVDCPLVGSSERDRGRRGVLRFAAMRHAVPAIYSGREYAEAGGLMSYGSDITDASADTSLCRWGVAGHPTDRRFLWQRGGTTPLLEMRMFDFSSPELRVLENSILEMQRFELANSDSEMHRFESCRPSQPVRSLPPTRLRPLKTAPSALGHV